MRNHKLTLAAWLLVTLISDASASDSDLATRIQACQQQPQSFGCANILNLRAIVVEPGELQYGHVPGHPLAAPLSHAIESHLAAGNRRAQDKAPIAPGKGANEMK